MDLTQMVVLLGEFLVLLEAIGLGKVEGLVELLAISFHSLEELVLETLLLDMGL